MQLFKSYWDRFEGEKIKEGAKLQRTFRLAQAEIVDRDDIQRFIDETTRFLVETGAFEAHQEAQRVVYSNARFQAGHVTPAAQREWESIIGVQWICDLGDAILFSSDWSAT